MYMYYVYTCIRCTLNSRSDPLQTYIHLIKTASGSLATGRVETSPLGIGPAPRWMPQPMYHGKWYNKILTLNNDVFAVILEYLQGLTLTFLWQVVHK